MKKACGIYEIVNNKGKVSYKIFVDHNDLQEYLKKNKNKTCKDMKPVYIINEYKEYPNTQIRKLSLEEIQKYMIEQEANRNDRYSK